VGVGGDRQQRRLIVGVYVDDLVITGDNIIELKQFKEEMKNTFLMANLGLLWYYLGLEVNQDEAGITVSQKGYALKILLAACMEDCNPSHTPMENCLKLSKSSSVPLLVPLNIGGLWVP
jgi:hypothetical protein